MSPTTRRRCPFCTSPDVWDRTRYLDASGSVTTYSAAVSFVESIICLSCNQPLPLGPAKDDGPFAEAVAIEVRAAELVEVYAGNAPGYDRFDWCPGGPGLCGNCQAAYLARCIATHADGSR